MLRPLILPNFLTIPMHRHADGYQPPGAELCPDAPCRRVPMELSKESKPLLFLGLPLPIALGVVFVIAAWLGIYIALAQLDEISASLTQIQANQQVAIALQQRLQAQRNAQVIERQAGSR
ncbi:hypothetical protein ALQ93_02887 [Pseudomonas syringae pv. pisi]|nr:hypothetical protein ALQ93_02887 [Pseudomonas syringae pv. pisi]RMM30231.1 hypothetical protein ALQ81_00385 [Pseudomonas syringae pv. pisi]